MLASPSREFRPSRSFLFLGIGGIVLAAALLILPGIQTLLASSTERNTVAAFSSLICGLVFLGLAAYVILFVKNARILTSDQSIQSYNAFGRLTLEARWEDIFTFELRRRFGTLSPYTLGAFGRYYTLPCVDDLSGAFLSELSNRLPHLRSRLTLNN